MNECWHALALALVSQDYYTPETAFEVLNTGIIRKNTPTDADTQDMIEMRKTMTYAEIGDIYGLNNTTIWHRINKKPKLPVTKKISDADVADMVRLKETMPYRQIGEMYGMTGQAIYDRIKRLIKL